VLITMLIGKLFQIGYTPRGSVGRRGDRLV